jgi:hypothetical protein
MMASDYSTASSSVLSTQHPHFLCPIYPASPLPLRETSHAFTFALRLFHQPEHHHSKIKLKKKQKLFLKTSKSTTEVHSIIAEYPCSYRVRLTDICNLMFITCHIYKRLTVNNCSIYTVMYNGYHNNSFINQQTTMLVSTNEEGLL